MPDLYEDHMTALDSPAECHFAITPADSNLAITPRAIYIGGAGNLVIRDKAGVDATYAVLAGQILPIRAVQVRASSTATGLVGLY